MFSSYSDDTLDKVHKMLPISELVPKIVEEKGYE